VKELKKYEDPDMPERPPALPRPRAGLWAPPGPEALEPPEVLVVGLGRRLRAGPEQGPRARLGSGAVETLMRRYSVKTYFDADAHAYIGSCKASLDKSGRAGVQKIHMLQPLADQDCDVGASMDRALQRPGMENAMVLVVLSDQRLPFGQLRMRSAYDPDDPRMRYAHHALGPENRVTCLHVGCGHQQAGEPLLPAEAGALPRVLANAATAIEVYLSEADLGLVMRFVNRPEVYEMPPGWPYNEPALPAATEPAAAAAVPPAASPVGSLPPAGAAGEQGDVASSAEPLVSYNLGLLTGPSDGDRFALFDLNRDDTSEPPESFLAPMSPQNALAVLAERPPDCEALLVAGRRYASLAALQSDLVELMLDTPPGQHLRLQDDEDKIRTLIAYHPDGDRLLEDLVEVKVESSPVDDDTRCYWVVKFDGYEEDISLRTCLGGLRKWLQLDPKPEATAIGEGMAPLRRLGPGRWTRGLRETTFDRAKVEESVARAANE